MSAADDDPAGRGASGADPPLTVELLADLQAGLLDEETAARVRSRVRSDPQAQRILDALNQARSDVAAVADPTNAPPAPETVVSRISEALRSESSRRTRGPAHAARPHTRPARLLAALAGLCAVAVAIGLGTAALVKAPGPTPRRAPTAQHITVSTPVPAIPLSQPEILELLRRPANYDSSGSTLGDPSRRASCLSGLGYPASTQVLGAQPIEINGRPMMLLVVPADAPDQLVGLAVALNCSAADTGLLASTVVPRA
ncbi:hypothetical protein [Mycobacterium spongiae]|uniref:Anti-sigma-M factor RsmA n=1 Tax=Mycobacterium spongiae TaxID=886343 RepID=A0A975PYT3_9MYCO|nr:hypothetical protein [Mycobacterium spongiae]QUR69477.1 hypothetical protein F6B93_22490 [Mycobacterium spongiae]